MVGMGGSSGWAARRTPDCSATGTTSCRNLSRRRHNSSWEMDGSVPGGALGIVNHVPDHSVRNRDIVGGAVHADGDGVAASQRCSYATAHAGQAEVVSQHRNAGFTHAANNCFDLFDLLRTLRAVEQNVVPVAGSRFSIAARTRPASSISRRSAFSSSTVHSFSGSPALPQGSYFPPVG